MSPNPSDPWIENLAALEALLGEVSDAARKKEVAYLHPAYQAMIAASPFAVLATVGPEGPDASPRGDPPGFVSVLDEHTLLLPERRGNNRVDSLRNIVADPRVALFFLIPGHGETLRVNGRARLSLAPELLQRFVVQGKPPLCVIQLSVESVFFQCARAIYRSKLWEHPPGQAPAGVPTPGAILEALTECAIEAAAYDADLPARQQATLYR